MNAMFYNLNSMMIEDPSSLGIKDLENNILRFIGSTKLKLFEDPLRGLRGIRFVSQYGFALDPDIIDIISQLKFKVRII